MPLTAAEQTRASMGGMFVKRSFARNRILQIQSRQGFLIVPPGGGC